MIRFRRQLVNRIAALRLPTRRVLRARTDDGFVLLESVISIGLVMVIVAALTALFTTTNQTTSHLRVKQEAIQLADSGIERVNSYTPEELMTGRDAQSV